MQKVLLTGTTGFIGSALYASILANEGFDARQVVRKTSSKNIINNCIEVEEFTGNTDFNIALTNIDIVIHLAAIAHVPNNSILDDAEKYKACNVDATVTLAKQAASNGVRRFIFLSSIGVNGIKNEVPFTSFDIEQPVESYAKSKYEAELALKQLAKETEMEIVIIRPPLVYGKGAPGNFGSLLKITKKNLPLPLGAINNQRSFVAIDNLIDLIVTCIDHPKAANQIFLVSDDEDISTSNLLKKLTIAAGKKPCLLPVSVAFLKLAASMVGKKEAVEKLSSSLVVDIKHTKATLSWQPPITLDEGIRRCFK